MTTSDWDKSVHPDLVDDEASSAPPERPARARGRAAQPAPTDTAGEEAPPVADATSEETPRSEGVASDQPDLAWFDQVREAKDPTEALRSILKNVPYDELQKDDVFSGMVGRLSDLRVQKLQEQQARDRQQQAKLEASANNDLYSLGEMTQRELQTQLASQQAAQAAGPFMDGVTLFQKDHLPEVIQQEVSGMSFGAGKSHAEGVAEYMAFVTDRAVKLGVEKELQRRESALRKSVMSEINGDEPVPERDSGTPGRVREVTDEQIAAMSLTEYDALFDENGRPKPGVRHRATRGIPVRQQ